MKSKQVQALELTILQGTRRWRHLLHMRPRFAHVLSNIIESINAAWLKPVREMPIPGGTEGHLVQYDKGISSTGNTTPSDRKDVMNARLGHSRILHQKAGIRGSFNGLTTKSTLPAIRLQEIRRGKRLRLKICRPQSERG